MKIQDFKRKKQQQQKITLLTCYDYPSARIIADSHIDCVLVGDSVAMTVHGYDNTLMATIDMMVLHTAAVARGIGQQFIISDLPFLCHRESQENTIHHVRRLLQAGANAIKIEGADTKLYELISYLVSSGVPVVGHIGLTPQFLHQMGGYVVQGKVQEQADQLLQSAIDLEAAGCCALVIECVPDHVAKKITQMLTIPTIGIGAGATTDGQILVWHDLLGLQTEFHPRFVKRFIDGNALLLQAINAYTHEVTMGHFPTKEHTF